jgi:hypothetical protein
VHVASPEPSSQLLRPTPVVGAGDRVVRFGEGSSSRVIRLQCLHHLPNVFLHFVALLCIFWN